MEREVFLASSSKFVCLCSDCGLVVLPLSVLDLNVYHTCERQSNDMETYNKSTTDSLLAKFCCLQKQQPRVPLKRKKKTLNEHQMLIKNLTTTDLMMKSDDYDARSCMLTKNTFFAIRPCANHTSSTTINTPSTSSSTSSDYQTTPMLGNRFNSTIRIATGPKRIPQNHTTLSKLIVEDIAKSTQPQDICIRQVTSSGAKLCLQSGETASCVIHHKYSTYLRVFGFALQGITLLVPENAVAPHQIETMYVAACPQDIFKPKQSHGKHQFETDCQPIIL
jgi:hypothetical protein